MKARILDRSVLTVILLLSIVASAAESQSNSLFPVKAKGKRGYIDKNGKTIRQFTK